MVRSRFSMKRFLLLGEVTILDVIIEVMPGASFGHREWHFSGHRPCSLRRGKTHQLGFTEANSCWMRKLNKKMRKVKMSCMHKEDRHVLSNSRMQPDIKRYVLSYKVQNRCLVLKLRGLNKGFKIEKAFLVCSTYHNLSLYWSAS